MKELEQEIKGLIIETLDLEDVTVDDIATDEALFGDGLGLDSIDALEIGLALKKTYGLVLEANSAESVKHFYSIASLASYVHSQSELAS